jgi:hypothetical protein
MGFRRPPACATLGDLDALPIELLNAILRYSDLRAVSMLRMLNRRARVIVDASLPYKHILLCAPHVVTALARTGVASHFPVDEVFHALSTPACHICGKFGMFLWIPECMRCCFACLREAPRLMPMGERDAKAAFGLTKSALARVPIMVTLPGTYTLLEVPFSAGRGLAKPQSSLMEGRKDWRDILNRGPLKPRSLMIDRWQPEIQRERLLTRRGESTTPLTTSPGS